VNRPRFDPVHFEPSALAPPAPGQAHDLRRAHGHAVLDHDAGVVILMASGDGANRMARDLNAGTRHTAGLIPLGHRYYDLLKVWSIYHDDF
jgi:hypothetical protein